MADEARRDILADGIRFACGAFIGLLVAFLIAIRWAVQDVLVFAALHATGAVVAGMLAVRFGERFWHGLRHLWWL